MHSFKTPRKKSLFSKESILWMTFVSVIFASLIAFGLYLFYKTTFFKDDLSALQSSNHVLSKTVIEYEKEMKILNMQRILSQEIGASNQLLKNSIKNLFDLVPDQIVLKKVVMEKTQLLLEGTTPTKDAYRLLLEPPLKSIFQSSKVVFSYDAFKGYYNFTSVNTVGNVKGEHDGKK